MFQFPRNYGLIVKFIFSVSICFLFSQQSFAQSPSNSHEASQSLNGELLSVVDGVVDQITTTSARGARSSAPIPGIFSNGRLGQTKHSGYAARNESFNVNFKSATSKILSSSYYASGELDLSDTVSLPNNQIFRVGLLGGYADLFSKLGPDIVKTGSATADSGKGRNKTYLLGAYALFAIDTTYITASVAGNWGKSKVSSFVATGVARGSYDTEGYNTAISLGHIFDLGNDIKVDGHAQLSYNKNEGDSFTDTRGDISGDATSSSLAGKFSLTFYKNIPLNNLNIKPYAKIGVRHRFDYENKVELHALQGGLANGAGLGRYVTFDDDDTFWHTELGLAVAAGSFKFNTSGYYEESSDSESVGGRVGVKYQF